MNIPILAWMIASVNVKGEDDSAETSCPYCFELLFIRIL